MTNSTGNDAHESIIPKSVFVPRAHGRLVIPSTLLEVEVGDELLQARHAYYSVDIPEIQLRHVQTELRNSYLLMGLDIEFQNIILKKKEH